MGTTEKEVTNEEFLKDIRYIEDESRYEVKLPWKAEYQDTKLNCLGRPSVCRSQTDTACV